MKHDAHPRGPGQVRGMSLLDYFAAHAMNALVTRVPWLQSEGLERPAGLAITAYDIADAMLVEARRRENEI